MTPPRPTARPATATPTPTPASRGWLNASAATIDVGGSTTVRASWEPPGLATWLGFASDSTAVLWRSSQCSGTRFVEPSEATLTVYGCQGGTGTVELRAVRSTGPVLASITITVRTPPTPRGELSATKTAIDVGEEVTVSAVNVFPSSQSVYIVTNGQLDFAGPGTCHFEINPRSSEKSAKSWTLEGCSPPGSGSVILKTRHNGNTVVLDSITIDVRTPPTPTPTPDSAPRGELSATKTAINVGENVTVNAVNVFPSSQSVYIVTNGQLDFARPGTCHVETGPRSSRALARSWTLEGCSPPGSGSVTLKTRHNGNTVILDSITIDVSPPPTATPTTAPTATTTPDTVPTATSTGPVTEPTATTTPQSGTVPVLPGQPIDQVPVPPDQTSPSQVAYRWLRVTWDAPSVYIRFKVESRDAHGNWGELQPVVRGEPKAGPRVITDHANRTADVRGLPHSTTTPVSFRITGVTASDVERTSAEVTITQRPAPQAIGHQHDHTVAYDLSRLPTSGLGHTIGSLAVGAADAWDRLPLVQLCSPDCPENSDRAIIYVELHENSPNACRSRVACVEWLSTIEDRIATTTMIYENPPYSSSGTQWQWTRHESLHRQLDISSGLRWLYLDAVVLHEFGHTLGLPDVEKPSHYVGIMRKGVPTTEMTNYDRSLLRQLYESHTPGEGW